jgi:thioredoxin reductase (NADPH)
MHLTETFLSNLSNFLSMTAEEAEKTYDLIILGAGPAGLTAGIYAARYKLDSLIIGPDVGGTCNLAHDVENWPGYKGSGMQLMQNFKEHVDSFNVPIKTECVKGIRKEGDIFTVTTQKGQYRSYSVMLAMGTQRRKVDAPGEDRLHGKGVSYCATCDAIFFRDKTVGIVGGANAAAMAAQILSEVAKKVYIIYRKERMRCEPARLDDLEKDPKVEFIYQANVAEIIGHDKLEKVKLDTGQEVELDGLFIEIGGVPIIALANDIGVELADNNRIKVDGSMSTNVPGVFAAGDITTGSNEFNQIVTAAAEGAVAAQSAFNFTKSLKAKSR